MKKLKVLFAIDEIEMAKIIIPSACYMLNKNNAEITLLNVIETTSADDQYFYKEPEKFIKHEAEKSEFASIEDFIINENFEYNGFIYREGDAAKIILDTASHENYDLIVLGSHNKHKIERFLLGSVSYKVSRYSKSSVLVIKPSILPKIKKSSPYSAMLAVDGSDYSIYASNEIENYLDKKRARINILNVTASLKDIISSDIYAYGDVEKIAEEAEAIADEILQNTAQDVLKQDLIISSSYSVPGEPASIIIEEAKKNVSSLIILGSHGKSGISSLLIGGVSSKVLEYSPLPVLIIKKQ